MDAQNVQIELDRYHDLLHKGKSTEDILSLYHDLVLEEFEEFHTAPTLENKIKEAVDLIVVTRPLIRFADRLNRDGNYVVSETVKGFLRAKDVNWCVALHRVNESNMSKFVLEREVDDAFEYFTKLGLVVEIDWLGDNFFGAFSSVDQYIGEKKFKSGKGLKGPNYQPINETTDWWK